MKQHAYTFRFVEFMPKGLDEGVLYVSTTYATASHLCFCGCGMKVVTPLSPTDWCLTFDGDTLSLHPSIGNWSYPCRSHYFLRGNRVVWSGPMSSDAIQSGRNADARDKQRYYARRLPVQVSASPATTPSAKERGWRRVLAWLSGP